MNRRITTCLARIAELKLTGAAVGLLWVLLVTGSGVHAATRSSASYSTTTETLDIAGGHSTSASYSSDGSAGVIAGVSNVAAPVVVARNGYIGQLYEIATLQITATPLTVNEGGTRQLGAVPVLDDATTFVVPATGIAWSLQSGPVSGINASGLATAATVYENTTATAQGEFEGKRGTLVLTIVNVGMDDFGSYAGDGLPDGWQVQHFGLSGPSSGPTLDPDFDGLQNRLEYSLNLNPSQHSALPAALIKNGGVLEYTYTRSKAAVMGGTQFQVEWSETLGAAGWSGSGVAEQVLSDNGTVQQVKATLPAGSLGRRFVRLRVP
ncbi:MAG: hypothetical protein QE570_12835 [Verrucomicrobiota bacterium]|nr:hypothetical protein [Verrucomicrobiota bacterium]